MPRILGLVGAYPLQIDTADRWLYKGPSFQHDLIQTIILLLSN